MLAERRMECKPILARFWNADYRLGNNLIQLLQREIIIYLSYTIVLFLNRNLETRSSLQDIKIPINSHHSNDKQLTLKRKMHSVYLEILVWTLRKF